MRSGWGAFGEGGDVQARIVQARRGIQTSSNSSCLSLLPPSSFGSPAGRGVRRGSTSIALGLPWFEQLSSVAVNFSRTAPTHCTQGRG